MIAQQPQPPSTDQEPPGTRAAAETSSQPNFSELLEQQLSQAIQPVLDDFWQHMAQAMQHQSATEPATGRPEAAANQEPSQEGQGSGQRGPLASGPPPASSVPAEPAASAQPPLAAEQEPAVAEPSDAGGGLREQAAITTQPAPAHQFAGALGPAVQFVERQTELWLQSLLVAGLTALLTESAHAAVRQRAEQGLHTLLLKTFERLPDGAGARGLQAQTEPTLQAILAETLDAIFAESLRATVQRQGEQVIREAVHGHFVAAMQSLQDALKALLDALVTVLRRQWQRVLRLVLKVVLVALETSLGQAVAGNENLEQPATAAAQIA